MGFFTALVTLPLAPVRGAAWVVEQVAEEADRQLHDESGPRRELLELELARDEGHVSDELYTERAAELLNRIGHARARRAQQAQLASEEMSDG